MFLEVSRSVEEPNVEYDISSSGNGNSAIGSLQVFLVRNQISEAIFSRSAALSTTFHSMASSKESDDSALFMAAQDLSEAEQETGLIFSISKIHNGTNINIAHDIHAIYVCANLHVPGSMHEYN